MSTSTPTSTPDNDTVVRDFLTAFNAQDADALAPFLTDDIVFTAYGDQPVEGREAVLGLWKNILATFAKVQFETVHQAVNGDVVIAEQVHGLALPGGKLAPIMNMAIYELREGKIAAWRDYSNPEYGRTLLQG